MCKRRGRRVFYCYFLRLQTLPLPSRHKMPPPPTFCLIFLLSMCQIRRLHLQTGLESLTYKCKIIKLLFFIFCLYANDALYHVHRVYISTSWSCLTLEASKADLSFINVVFVPSEPSMGHFVQYSKCAHPFPYRRLAGKPVRPCRISKKTVMADCPTCRQQKDLMNLIFLYSASVT